MDLKKILDKATECIDYAADATIRTTGDFCKTSKANMRIFDLNTEINALYKEIGTLVYRSHNGADILPEQITILVNKITEKHNEIDILRDKNDQIRNTVVCKYCNTVGRREHISCVNCGRKF